MQDLCEASRNEQIESSADTVEVAISDLNVDQQEELYAKVDFPYEVIDGS